LEEKDPIALLGGTGLKVYLYLLRSKKPMGIREIQRALGFKSPSTARHHLERLVELGLARREGWGYVALRPKGLLEDFIVIQGSLYPKSLFLLGFLVTSLIGYSLLPGRDLRAVVIIAIATIISFIEVIRSYLAIRKMFK
jgi:DNA-binding transcriptional ArsR family regulator